MNDSWFFKYILTGFRITDWLYEIRLHRDKLAIASNRLEKSLRQAFPDFTEENIQVALKYLLTEYEIPNDRLGPGEGIREYY